MLSNIVQLQLWSPTVVAALLGVIIAIAIAVGCVLYFDQKRRQTKRRSGSKPSTTVMLRTAEVETRPVVTTSEFAWLDVLNAAVSVSDQKLFVWPQIPLSCAIRFTDPDQVESLLKVQRKLEEKRIDFLIVDERGTPLIAALMAHASSPLDKGVSVSELLQRTGIPVIDISSIEDDEIVARDVLALLSTVADEEAA